MTPVSIRVSALLAIVISVFGAPADDAKWSEVLAAGNQAIREGEYLTARQHYTAAMQFARSLPPDHPLRAYSLGGLGSVEMVIGNERQAEQYFRDARQILIKNKLEATPEYAQVLAGLGMTQTNQGHWVEAEPLLKEASTFFPAGSERRAAIQTRLGALYSAQGRMPEALEQFNESIEIQKKALPANRNALVYSLEALGSTWLAQGRLQRAEECLREAWQLSRELPEGHLARADSAAYLASVLFLEGSADRAAPLLKSALKIYSEAFGDHTCQLGPVLTTLARIDISEKHFALAEEKLQRVLEIFEQCHPAGHVAIGYAEVNLAQLYLDEQKFEQARPLLESAVGIMRATYPGMHPNLAIALYEGARLQAGLRDYPQADAYFRESISVYEKTASPHDPQLGSMLRTYAAFLKRIHRNSEAKPLEARARGIFAFKAN